MLGSPAYADADVLQILWQVQGLRQTAAQVAVSFGVTRNAVLGLVHRVARQEMATEHFSDGALLMMLDRFSAGVSAEALAKDFGVTRMQVLGVLHAVRLDLGRAGADACKKPENRNGGMGARWWQAGLAAQVAA